MAEALPPDAYTVGFVCALPLEQVAVRCFLDSTHSSLESAPLGDNNDYTLGTIGKHNVVIAGLPIGRYGTTNAAVVARDMIRTFPNIRFGLMVGIGGGAPSEQRDIRLGDIVVGMSSNGRNEILQYDYGRTIQEKSFQRIESRNNTPILLQNAVSGLATEYKMKGHRLQESMQAALKAYRRIRKEYKKPDASSDILFRSDYLHLSGADIACSELCVVQPEHLVERSSPEAIEEGSDDDEDIRDDPTIHYGMIASANQLMKDALIRDVLAKKAGVLCFEMEAAGLQDHFPCLVVRGICDYSDTHKNYRWQGYAALAAAAYAKDLLLRIPPRKVEAEQIISKVVTDLQDVVEAHRDIALRQLEIKQDTVKQKLSDKQHRLLQLFRLTDSTEDATYEWYKDRVEDRVEGTCTWFLEHDHFQGWQNQDAGPLLVSADPGCGKSVLAKYLVDSVLPPSGTICYFFFKDQVQNTVRQALCAVLHQLFSQKPFLIEHVVEQFEGNGPALINSLRSLWTILEGAVMDARAGPIIIVLDALDECTEADFENLMKNVEIQLGRALSSRIKLKYLLTSRPYEQILSNFRTLLDRFPRIRIPGEEESERISEEVNHVIQNRVDRLAIEKALPETAKTHLLHELLKITHRTYLWVYLIFDYLKTEDFKKTAKGIQSSIQTLPKSVNEAYEKILSRSKEHKKIQKILSIVLAAQRPLTLSEMNVAVEIDETLQDIQSLDLEEEDSFKTRLRSWCGLFVSIYHNKIFFLHQTAREFLLAAFPSSTGLFEQPRWHHSISFQQANGILSDICVRYLSLLEPGTGSKAGFDEANGHDAPILLDYCARFWGIHYREGSGNQEDDAMIATVMRLSDPLSDIYSLWSPIYWAGKDMLYVKGFSPLVVASHFGHTVTMKLLLENGADVNTRDARCDNALVEASRRGHYQAVKLLLENGAEIDAHREGKNTALQAASIERHVKVVKLLLDQGAEVNKPMEPYGDALRAAAVMGYEDVVVCLLDHGADINANGGKCGSALLAATLQNGLQGHEAIVKLLLDRGAEVNEDQGLFGNAVHTAAYRGHVSILKILISHMKENELRDAYGRNLLWWAAAGGSFHTVQLLLTTYGYDPQITDHAGRTPGCIAKKRGYVDVAHLLSHGDDTLDLATSQTHYKDLDFTPLPTCMVCVCKVQRGLVYHYCVICNQGNGNICPDCKSRGVNCKEPSHILVELTAQDSDIKDRPSAEI